MSDPHAAFRPPSDPQSAPPPPKPEVPEAPPHVRAVQLYRTYDTGSHTVEAVKNANLEVAPGDLVAVHGRSGSGKTTLLNMLGGLDRPTSGEVWLTDAEITSMSEAQFSSGTRRLAADPWRGESSDPCRS